MNYRIGVTAVSCLVLGGCGLFQTKDDAVDHGSVIRTTTKPDGSIERVENLSDQAAYYRAKSEIAGKPLFRMACPAEGCKFASLEVSSPNSAGDIAAPAPPPKVENAVVGVVRELKEGILGLAPIAAPVAIVQGMARYGTRIANRFGDSIDTIATNVSRPNQVTVTGSNSAASVNGPATSTGPNSGAQSGNTGRINSNDANQTNSHNPVTDARRDCRGGQGGQGGTTGEGGSAAGGTC